MANYRKVYKLKHPPKRGGWYECAYCGKKIRWSDAHVDHIWPRSKGGPDAEWNLVVACPECNLKKSDKIGWHQAQGYFYKIFKE